MFYRSILIALLIVITNGCGDKENPTQPIKDDVITNMETTINQSKPYEDIVVYGADVGSIWFNQQTDPNATGYFADVIATDGLLIISEASGDKFTLVLSQIKSFEIKAWGNGRRLEIHM
jgi:hypothetical protein